MDVVQCPSDFPRCAIGTASATIGMEPCGWQPGCLGSPEAGRASVGMRGGRQSGQRVWGDGRCWDGRTNHWVDRWTGLYGDGGVVDEGVLGWKDGCVGGHVEASRWMSIGVIGPADSSCLISPLCPQTGTAQLPPSTAPARTETASGPTAATIGRAPPVLSRPPAMKVSATTGPMSLSPHRPCPPTPA